MTTAILSWAGFVFGLVGMAIATLSYLSSESTNETHMKLETERLSHEAMDLLLFKPTGPGELSWNIERGKFLTSAEDRNRLEKARRKITNIETLDPDNELLPIFKFSYYVQFGDVKSSEKILLEGFDGGKRAELLMLAAVFHANIKEDIESVKKYFEIAVRDSAENPEIYRMYGVLLHSFGENEESIKQLQKALELNPNNVETKNDIAHVYSESKQLDVAEKILTELIRSKQASGRTYNTLGIIMFFNKKYEKAIKNYSKAVELNPEIGMFHKNLSLSYTKVGDAENSKKHERLARKDIRLRKEFLESEHPYH